MTRVNIVSFPVLGLKELGLEELEQNKSFNCVFCFHFSCSELFCFRVIGDNVSERIRSVGWRPGGVTRRAGRFPPDLVVEVSRNTIREVA